MNDKSNKVPIWKDGEVEYTEEQLYIHAELGIMANKILNMPVPRYLKKPKAIHEVRKYAAIYLHSLGYSTREISSALGLKSPQSVQKYLAGEK